MTEDLLREGRRCMLAFAGARGPHITPMAFWSDGASLWMATSASSLKARWLNGPSSGADPGALDAGTEPGCAVYIPPVDRGTGGDASGDASGDAVGDGGRGGPIGPGRGLAIDGRARVFTLDDPVGLMLHWPFLSAAMAALAVKNAPSLAGYARDLPRTPLRWLPTNRVAVRVRIERMRPVVPPVPGGGIAPALPGVVPPDVRRALAGRRDAVVATAGPQGVVAQPAAMGAGFSLDVGDGAPLQPGTPAVVALDAEPSSRPSQVVGLALHGTVAPGPKMDVERAVWWEGFDVSGAQIPRRPAGAIVLPD